MNKRRAASVLFLALMGAGWAETIQKSKTDAATEEIHIPAGKGNLPAEEVFRNIQVLRGRPASRLPEIMKSLNRQLGVQCSYCHAAGKWQNDQMPATKTTRGMFRMTRSIREKYFDGREVVSCWTCHRGRPKPGNGASEVSAGLANLPRERRQLIESIDPGPDKNKSSEQAYQNIQVLNEMPAAGMARTMAVFTVALGVECSHCHLADQWDDDDKPAKQTTREMIQMVTGIKQTFAETQGSVTCWSCHRGNLKPQIVPGPPN